MVDINFIYVLGGYQQEELYDIFYFDIRMMGKLSLTLQSEKRWKKVELKLTWKESWDLNTGQLNKEVQNKDAFFMQPQRTRMPL
jgi:hypothetical protein